MKTLPKRVMACAMAASMLAGCASQAAMDQLAGAQARYDETVRHCEVDHDPTACQAFPVASADLTRAQDQVNHEKATNGRTAAILVLAPLLILGAAAAAGGPPSPPVFHPPPPPPPRW